MIDKIKVISIINYTLTIVLVLLGIYGIFISGLKANTNNQLIFLLIAMPVYILSEKYKVKYNEITFPVGVLFGIIITFWG
ncbi:MAG: hypothetical protein KO202_07770 [Methanobacteriaceae archaeon]|jgi:hypothetical protein|nr:hypothetical protein [Methanobacteriaceae archaeon]